MRLNITHFCNALYMGFGIFKICDKILKQQKQLILRKLYIELYVHYAICIPIPHKNYL